MATVLPNFQIPNYSPGNLIQGQAFGTLPQYTILKDTSTSIVLTGPVGYLQLKSEDVPASRTISISNGSYYGQTLVIQVQEASDPTYGAQLLDSGNCNIASTWAGTLYDTLTLIWNGNGLWCEVCRTEGNTGSPFNPIISTPLDGEIIVYDGVALEWKNQAIQGDATIDSTAVMTIAAGAIDDGKIAALAAIDLSKLDAVTNSRALVSDGSGFVSAATTTSTEIGYVNGVTSSIQTQLDAKVGTSLVSGNILVGSAGNAAASVTMSGDATIIADGTLTIAANAVTIAKSARNIIMESTGTITSAQILDLFNTPVELVAAPAAGYYYVVDEMEIFHDYATAPYILGGSLIVELGTTDLFSFPNTLVTGGADQYFLATVEQYATTPSGGVVGMDITTSIAANIQITNDGALFANGDAANILKYRIRYHMVQALT
jgi:hypothetical protein